MKQGALEQYTKQKKLYGQNQQQILDKFIQYAAVCSDPMNIFKYMQQKSICIYLANYWINRAVLFADMGDFKDAVLCLRQALSRNHIINQNQVRVQEYIERIRKKLVTVMKRLPPKSKRTANQYNFLYEKQQKITIQKLQQLVTVYEKNYKQCKKQIQKQYSLKMHGKKLSWLASIQQMNQQKMRKISQKIHGDNNMVFSMRTPISKKDPMRLTKTMDSVQMLKRKKSTQIKQKDKNKFRQKFGQNKVNTHSSQSNLNQKGSEIMNQSQQNDNLHEQRQEKEEEQDDNSHPLCINTTPVGRELRSLSRRVTFNTKTKSSKFSQIQKLRNNEDQNDKDKDKSSNNNNSNVKQPQKLLENHLIKNNTTIQDDIQKTQGHVQKSKSITRRGSILKNKHHINYEADIQADISNANMQIQDQKQNV